MTVIIEHENYIHSWLIKYALEQKIKAQKKVYITKINYLLLKNNSVYIYYWYTLCIGTKNQSTKESLSNVTPLLFYQIEP